MSLPDAIRGSIMQLSNQRRRGAFTASDWKGRQLRKDWNKRRIPFGALSEIPVSEVEASGDSGRISR